MEIFIFFLVIIILIIYLAEFFEKKGNNNIHLNPQLNQKENQFNTTLNNTRTEAYQRKPINPPLQENKYEDEFPYMPYQRKKLLTYTEYQFYKIMKQACDEKNLLICPKVRLEDFINVTERKYKMKYRGYIKARHVDFIVTDSQLNVLCGIELDDPSHNTQDAARTDAFKNKLFRTIGIPLFRIDTSTKYEIRMNYIFRQLGIIPPTQTYQAEQAAKQNTP